MEDMESETDTLDSKLSTMDVRLRGEIEARFDPTGVRARLPARREPSSP